MSKASTAVKLRQVNELLRSWGIEIAEQEGCWQRDNSIKDWTAGEPVGMMNHHFVIPLKSPEKDGVNNVTYGDSTLAGPKCNWYVHERRITFIASGPANHAGRGSNEVLQRVASDQPYRGTGPDDYNGNSFFLGQESHHPGDSTPWPDSLVRNVVALNAAVCIVFGWSPYRTINHKWHTTRKIDMSSSFPRNIQDSTAIFIRELSDHEKPKDWYEEMDDLTFQRKLDEAVTKILDNLPAKIRDAVYVLDDAVGSVPGNVVTDRVVQDATLDVLRDIQSRLSTIEGKL